MAPVATLSAAAWHSPAGQCNNLFMTDTWDMHCVALSACYNSTAWGSRMQRQECEASLRVTCCTSSAADGLSAGLGCNILSITERRMGRCPSRASCLPSALFLGSFSPAHAHVQHDLTVFYSRLSPPVLQPHKAVRATPQCSSGELRLPWSTIDTCTQVAGHFCPV